MKQQIKPALESLVLGQDTQTLEIGSSAEQRDAVLAMLGQTRRSVRIISRHLDAAIYDNEAVVNAFKGIALANRRAQIRILVQDIAPVVKEGHRLVDLSRRLSSFMKLRVPAKEHASYNNAVLVADDIGTIFRAHAGRYEGSVNFNDMRNAEDYVHLFDEMWDHAHEHAELRRLKL